MVSLAHSRECSTLSRSRKPRSTLVESRGKTSMSPSRCLFGLGDLRRFSSLLDRSLLIAERLEQSKPRLGNASRGCWRRSAEALPQ